MALLGTAYLAEDAWREPPLSRDRLAARRHDLVSVVHPPPDQAAGGVVDPDLGVVVVATRLGRQGAGAAFGLAAGVEGHDLARTFHTPSPIEGGDHENAPHGLSPFQGLLRLRVQGSV